MGNVSGDDDEATGLKWKSFGGFVPSFASYSWMCLESRISSLLLPYTLTNEGSYKGLVVNIEKADRASSFHTTNAKDPHAIFNLNVLSLIRPEKIVLREKTVSINEIVLVFEKNLHLLSCSSHVLEQKQTYYNKDSVTYLLALLRFVNLNLF